MRAVARILSMAIIILPSIFCGAQVRIINRSEPQNKDYWHKQLIECVEDYSLGVWFTEDSICDIKFLNASPRTLSCLNENKNQNVLDALGDTSLFILGALCVLDTLPEGVIFSSGQALIYIPLKWPVEWVYDQINIYGKDLPYNKIERVHSFVSSLCNPLRKWFIHLDGFEDGDMDEELILPPPNPKENRQ